MGLKILLIEPDPALCALMGDALLDAGYEPVSCAPVQAVERAAGLPAAAIVVSLSSAAVEQSPLYTALKLDPRTKAIPIIIITGRGDATIRRRLGEKPPCVLFKPFKPDSLVGAVASALAGA